MGWIYCPHLKGRSGLHRARTAFSSSTINLPGKCESCLFSRPPGLQQAGEPAGPAHHGSTAR